MINKSRLSVTREELLRFFPTLRIIQAMEELMRSVKNGLFSVGVEVVNNTTSPIAAGVPVGFVQFSLDGRTEVKAHAPGDIYMGITETAITDRLGGTVVKSGTVEGLNTAAWSVGDVLYAGAGVLTTTDTGVRVGVVLKSDETHGVIYL